MKTIITILTVCLVAVTCESWNQSKVKFESYTIPAIKQPKEIMARITYYSPEEKDYPYGKQIASNPKGKAVENYTVAVDPKKIQYGTFIYIPKLAEAMGGGIFKAEDTGKDVKRMVAISKSKRDEVNYVIDVFVEDNETMKKMANSMPHYMKVYVYE